MSTRTEVQYKPLLIGAALGGAILFLMHPHHGERRRNSLKRNCADAGTRAQEGWVAMLARWTGGWVDQASDFQAEIRAHAPPYLQ